MWIYLQEGFLSIVENARDPKQLMVRARRRNHLAKAFPNAKIIETPPPRADYPFRILVDRKKVAEFLTRRCMSMTNHGVKDSFQDEAMRRSGYAIWDVTRECLNDAR